MPQLWFHQFGLVLGVLEGIKRPKNPTTKRFSITAEGVTVYQRRREEKLAITEHFLISFIIIATQDLLTIAFKEWIDPSPKGQ